MMILSITLEESKINDISILDWLCSVETKKGISNDKFWLIDTDTHIAAQHITEQVNLVNNLLMQAKANGYMSLQIIKNGAVKNSNTERSTEQQFGDSGTTQNTDTQIPGSEVSSASMDVESNGTES